VIFKDINDNQKPMPTKLVNTILLKTKGPLAEPDKEIAQRLHSDASSPFYGRVDLGGRRPSGYVYFTSSEGLRSSVVAALHEYVDEITNPRITTGEAKAQLQKSYEFLRNFWRACKRVWPDAWDLAPLAPPKPRLRYVFQQYKLLTTPGILGISAIAYEILKQKCIPEDDFSEPFIFNLLSVGRGFDWDKDSREMQGVAGPGGARVISKALRDLILPAKL
jgi:hypothetical protein